MARRTAAAVSNAAEGSDIQAALALLKGLGLLDGRGLLVGSDDPEGLKREADILAREEKVDREPWSLFAD